MTIIAIPWEDRALIFHAVDLVLQHRSDSDIHRLQKEAHDIELKRLGQAIADQSDGLSSVNLDISFSSAAAVDHAAEVLNRMLSKDDHRSQIISTSLQALTRLRSLMPPAYADGP